jgi:hypothetical protein
MERNAVGGVPRQAAPSLDARSQTEAISGAFTSWLAAGLVSTFGWAPAIAAVVAALVVRLFLKNAYLATCQV